MEGYGSDFDAKAYEKEYNCSHMDRNAGKIFHGQSPGAVGKNQQRYEYGYFSNHDKAQVCQTGFPRLICPVVYHQSVG